MTARTVIWLGSFLVLATTWALQSRVRGDGPKDNLPDKVRPIPPQGIAVPAEDRAALEAGIQQLGQEIAGLRTALKGKPALLALLPDVQIYHNAVRYALQHDEFFKPAEIANARNLLKQGLERAQLLRDGKAPWTSATGLVVRGYVSRLDGSVQPYGLVVPTSYQPGTPTRHRLDVWLHGRGETLSEVNFLQQRQNDPGQFTPPHAFVLHPYGRYCNANRFAGEVDVLEALEHVKQHYAIDDNRLVLRGFSMGGAGCWQLAVHYPTLWVAAAPGAGFAETTEFLRVFQDEIIQSTWFQKKLLHLYDATDYAVNLANCPVVAYSGEVDRQKQAADIMGKALGDENIHMVHVIGPKTGHSYHPLAKQEINRRIDSIAAKGKDPVPPRLRFTTWTLRYNKCGWVTVEGLAQHWERARVDAELRNGPHDAVLTTQNVTALTLSMPPGYCPFDVTRRPKLLLDGQEVEGAGVLSDRSWTTHFKKEGARWRLVESLDDGVLRKRPGLQGPIDDAFLDSFLMVRPTGQPFNKKVGAWTAAEQAHAVKHWRQQFRGEARVKADEDVTDEDIANHNLVLWGDPQSNKVLAKILGKLPVRWDAKTVQVGASSHDAGRHALVLIYPNPLNPARYVVLNSGFTFREYDYLNNARQVARLPDYAVIDLDVPVSSRAPGGIAAAGFFDETWQVPAP